MNYNLDVQIVEMMKQSINLSQEKSSLDDISSSNKYQSLVELGELGGLHQISFNLFYDGMAPHQSSSVSIWPLWASLNEIPAEHRYKEDNIFLFGVYFGAEKPDGNNFLAPLVHQFCQLYESKPLVKINNELWSINVLLFSVIADLPAKSNAMVMQSFNSFYGCTKCLQKGKYSAHKMCFPFVSEDKRPLRDTKDIIEIFTTNKISTDTPYKGIKGFSVLNFLPHFDLYADMCIDGMHLHFLNICKKIFKLWISGNSEWKFHIAEKEGTFERMKLPSFLASFHVALKNWKKFKAVNWKYWALYLSFPLIYTDDEMPASWKSHWIRYIKILLLCCSSSISKDLLPVLQKECDTFISDHTNLYGKENCTINIHYLHHLTNDLAQHGMTNSHSAFPFESMNGCWKKELHGSQAYPKGALITYENNLFLSLQPKIEPESLESRYNVAGIFYSKFKGKLFLVENLENINQQLRPLSIQAQSALSYQMIHNSMIQFETKKHSNTTATSNSAIMWKFGDTMAFGHIESILEIHPQKQIYFQVQKLTNFLEKKLHFFIYHATPTEIVWLPFGEHIKTVVCFQLNNVSFFCDNVSTISW